MATIKEFSNGKIGVQVYIKVNHQNKKQRSNMISWFGYTGEPNGKTLLAWMEIKTDVPVEIPCADVSISAQFKDQEKTIILKRKSPDYQNHYSVTITKGNVSESFDYRSSINDTDEGIVNLTDSDKINAFYCFVQDAISGTMSCKEFKSEFGYDDCCEAHRVWKMCKDATIKAARLGLGDLYTLSEEIQNVYPDVL